MGRPKTQRDSLGPVAANHRSNSKARAVADEVLTLPEAAAYLRTTEAELLHLLAIEDIPARRIGTEWRFLKSALQQWLAKPRPAVDSKQHLLRWAGAFKDDPDLPLIVHDAYRRRGRSITENRK